MTRHPLGRKARPMLVNAATGSAKNIVPNRLMAMSKLADGKVMGRSVGVLEADVVKALPPPSAGGPA